MATKQKSILRHFIDLGFALFLLLIMIMFIIAALIRPKVRENPSLGGR